LLWQPHRLWTFPTLMRISAENGYEERSKQNRTWCHIHHYFLAEDGSFTKEMDLLCICWHTAYFETWQFLRSFHKINNSSSTAFKSDPTIVLTSVFCKRHLLCLVEEKVCIWLTGLWTEPQRRPTDELLFKWADATTRILSNHPQQNPPPTTATIAASCQNKVSVSFNWPTRSKKTVIYKRVKVPPTITSCPYQVLQPHWIEGK
jgi:hypothetical protein